MAAPWDNVLGTVFQPFSLHEDAPDTRLNDLLSVIQSTQILSQQSLTGIQDLLSFTHRSLGTSKNRHAGITLLGQVVSQCSTEVFQQSALTWCNLLLQVLQGHCRTLVYEASCRIFAQIFYFAKNFTDISREIIGSVIPQLVPLLVATTPKVKLAAISCLSSIIQTYPGPLAPFRTKIETCVFTAIDADSNDKEVLRCFSQLPQIGPGGTQGVKHSEAWALLCQQTLGSLGETLSDLYDGVEIESSKSSKGKESLPLTPIEPDQPSRVSSLVSRFLCLSACLQELLREGPDTSVKLPVEDVLQLVCRSTAVNAKMLLSRPSTERLYLAAHVSSVHVGAWSIMKQLIVTCRSLLLPHSSVIVGLFSQELGWTATEHSGHTIQYSQLRETVYNTMTAWLRAVNAGSGMQTEDKALVTQILQDCTFATDSVKVSGPAPGDRADPSTSVAAPVSQKKKKHKGYQEITQGISSQRKIHHHGNHVLVNAALEALYWLLLTSGSEMAKQALQDVQRFCVRTLLSLQQAVVRQVPYINVGYRRGLYRVLHACTLTTHPAAPPPTQCAYGIFRAGLQDESLEISSFCIEALRSCELVIHPRAPCLNGPIVCENVIQLRPHPVTDHTPQAGPVTNGHGPAIGSTDAFATKTPVDDNFGFGGANTEIVGYSLAPLSRKRTVADDTDKDSTVVMQKLAKLDNVNRSGEMICESRPSTSKYASDIIDVDLESEIDSINEDELLEETADDSKQDIDSDSVDNDEKQIEIVIDEDVALKQESDEDSLSDIQDISESINVNVGTTAADAEIGVEQGQEETGEPEFDEGTVADDIAEGLVEDEGNGVLKEEEEEIKEESKDETVAEQTNAEPAEEDKKEVEAVLMTFVDAAPDDD